MLLALAGCVSAPASPPLRNPDVPIASTTRFDLSQFGGRWFSIEAAGESLGEEFLLQASDLGRLSYYIVVRIGQDEELMQRAGFNLLAPGRLERAGAADEVVWVLWTTESHDLAALGSPDGRFAQIVSKSRSVRPDRLAAAREVLAFNGFDLDQLRVVE